MPDNRSYDEKLKDPKWFERRRQILSRDNLQCTQCGSESDLCVHHKKYINGYQPWDYPDDLLVTLCKECHENKGGSLRGQIPHLQEAYETLTGLAMHFVLHERRWYDFLKAGFNERDLRDVIAWIQRQNQKNTYQYSLKLSTLIGNLEHFDEMRAQAQIRKSKQRTDTQKVLDNFRNYEEPLPTEKVIPIGAALKKAVNEL